MVDDRKPTELTFNGPTLAAFSNGDDQAYLRDIIKINHPLADSFLNWLFKQDLNKIKIVLLEAQSDSLLAPRTEIRRDGFLHG